MITNNPQDDYEYIMKHLRNPQTILDADFQNWLKNSDNKILYERIVMYRSAWIYSETGVFLDVEKEYAAFQRHRAKVDRHKRHIAIRWIFCAASVIILVGLVITVRFASSPRLLTANEEQISDEIVLLLGDGAVLHPQKDTVALKERNLLSEGRDQRQLSYTNVTDTLHQLVYNTLKIPAGADYFVELCDGTKVWLNCETNFRFPVHFDKNTRDVYLDGEAYFEVSSSKEHPFIVHTKNMNVTVTGTRFNVCDYSQDESVTTTLVEGRVHVNDEQLLPSEQFILNKNTGVHQVSKVDTEIYVGWREGLFVFKSQPLEEVMTTIARWYQVDVFWSNEAVKQLKFSGNVPRYESIDTLLHLFERMDKVHISKQNNTLIISR